MSKKSNNDGIQYNPYGQPWARVPRIDLVGGPSDGGPRAVLKAGKSTTVDTYGAGRWLRLAKAWSRHPEVQGGKGRKMPLRGQYATASERKMVAEAIVLAEEVRQWEGERMRVPPTPEQAALLAQMSEGLRARHLEGGWILHTSILADSLKREQEYLASRRNRARRKREEAELNYRIGQTARIERRVRVRQRPAPVRRTREWVED